MKSILVVDGAYLFRGAKAFGRFDYLKLKTLLEAELQTSFAELYYLNAVPDASSGGLDAFHSWMKSAPPRGPKFRVQLYDLKQLSCRCPSCAHDFDRTVQKGVDVGIATLALKLAMQGRYDRFVLCAGDGDFEDAIRYIHDECGKEFVLVGFGSSLSTDLQSYATRVLFLDDHWSAIERVG